MVWHGKSEAPDVVYGQVKLMNLFQSGKLAHGIAPERKIVHEIGQVSAERAPGKERAKRQMEILIPKK